MIETEIYGSPEVHPQKEDYWGCVNPVGTRSCYDEGDFRYFSNFVSTRSLIGRIGDRKESSRSPDVWLSSARRCRRPSV